MLPIATSVERLLLRDRYTRILAAEMLALLSTLSASVHIFIGDETISLSLLVPIILVVISWIRWETRRKRRFMKIFQVKRVHSITLPLTLGNTTHFAPLICTRFEAVEAVNESMTVRYVDYEDRRVGEKVLLIFDGGGRVLAVAPLDRPPRLDVVSRLG